MTPLPELDEPIIKTLGDLNETAGAADATRGLSQKGYRDLEQSRRNAVAIDISPAPGWRRTLYFSGKAWPTENVTLIGRRSPLRTETGQRLRRAESDRHVASYAEIAPARRVSQLDSAWI